MDCTPWFAEMMSAHLSEDEIDDIFEKLQIFEGPEEVLVHVKLLKDEGNYKFKKNNTQAARECYEQAAKLLSCILPSSKGNMDEFRDLAISHNLNIAACALELHDFHRVLGLCSLVLELDSNIVKALFWRALAAKELGVSNASYLELAYHDLVKAAKIEQNNKDIQSELHEARTAFFARGKRKLDNSVEYDRDLKGPKAKVEVEVEGESLCSQVDVVMGVMTTPLVVGRDQDDDDCTTKLERSNLRDDSQGPNLGEESSAFEGADSGVLQPPSIDDSNSVNEFNMAEPYFWYSNRRRQGSFLKLPLDTYNSLNQRKEITVFHSRSPSFMTVRLLSKESKVPNFMSSDRDGMDLETPNPLHVSGLQYCPFKIDEVHSSSADSSPASCLMHLLSTKERDSTLVSDGSHTKEVLDPSQLNFVVPKGNCIADQQPSHSVFKFA